MNFMILFMIDN